MTAQSKVKPQSLLGALAEALPKLEAAKKNSANPHFKSKYADLGSVIAAIQPIADHGLWFRQVSHEAENGVCIETFYIHEGEELSAGKVFVPADRNNAQGYGSAQTYARRYGLQMAFGLATEDDDGNAAAAAPPKKADQVDDDTLSLIIEFCEAIPGNQSGAIKEAYKIDQLTELTASQAKAVLERLKEKAKEPEHA